MSPPSPSPMESKSALILELPHDCQYNGHILLTFYHQITRSYICLLLMLNWISQHSYYHSAMRESMTLVSLLIISWFPIIEATCLLCL
jgi:hypothetical protein